MRVLNMMSKPVCVGDTIEGEAKANWILKPGAEMIVADIFPTLGLAFVDTPDGLRVIVTILGAKK